MDECQHVKRKRILYFTAPYPNRTSDLLICECLRVRRFTTEPRGLNMGDGLSINKYRKISKIHSTVGGFRSVLEVVDGVESVGEKR